MPDQPAEAPKLPRNQVGKILLELVTWIQRFANTRLMNYPVLLLLYTQENGRNAADAMRELVFDLAALTFGRVLAVLAFALPIWMDGAVYH